MRTLILTTFGRPGYLRRALEHGARGFLLKDAPAASSPPRSAPSSPAAARSTRRSPPPTITEGESPLTAREHDVLRAAMHARHGGRRSPPTLHLSEGTVRNYLSAAIQKLGARNRREAIAHAVEKGWL